MIKESYQDKVFDVINFIFLTLVLMIVLYPLIYIISASVSDPMMVGRGEMLLFPKGLTFEGYKRVFQDQDIWRSYLNSFIYTIIGTAINLVMTLLCAYPLSRKDLRGRNIFTAIITFTMFFGGGLIPTYLLIKNLKMINTIWAIVIPGAISVYNMIITRTYFQSLPIEMQEAAVIDGCNNTKIFLKIVLPLSAPIVGVMAMYYGVGHWNSFFNALIYLSERKFYPLQLILREILVQQEMSTAIMSTGGNVETIIEQARIAEIIKYAVMIVASLPVIIAYPFLQKFFVKGVMIGSIKG